MLKSAIMAIALTMGGAAAAQTPTYVEGPMTDDRIALPANDNPERDMRGILVISAPALVPVGWNGVMNVAVGGPYVDPVTGEAIEMVEDDYPPCTATITDNCVQAYMPGVDL